MPEQSASVRQCPGAGVTQLPRKSQTSPLAQSPSMLQVLVVVHVPARQASPLAQSPSVVQPGMGVAGVQAPASEQT